MLTRVRELHWWQKKLRGPLWLIPDSVFEGSASILIILVGFSTYFTLLSSCFYLAVSFFAKLQWEFVTLISTWWQINTLKSSSENYEIFHFCFYTTPLFILYIIHLTFVVLLILPARITNIKNLITRIWVSSLVWLGKLMNIYNVVFG